MQRHSQVFKWTVILQTHTDVRELKVFRALPLIGIDRKLRPDVLSQSLCFYGRESNLYQSLTSWSCLNTT